MIRIFYFFFLTFCLPLGIWKSWVRDWSHGCDVNHSFDNTESLTNCARPGVKPTARNSQDTTYPIALFFCFLLHLSISTVICIKFIIKKRWPSFIKFKLKHGETV